MGLVYALYPKEVVVFNLKYMLFIAVMGITNSPENDEGIDTGDIVSSTSIIPLIIDISSIEPNSGVVFHLILKFTSELVLV